ncbi:3-deoxy-D-arabinoheptulosonate-7-phosphate synthase [Saccharothrix carnea]|uniref:Phospho-2-dehydro-3-deoxyheptonate aldolase n=1 Tax=Saccharothrix carnea TaxID=1280637 RepID=A0A2P8I1A7_SACCR|nr:3-deoxy-7-phosphoheptulonate synthase [Saccharothrix carnea]PSL52247.1 3-deoxy-D-arabinoheptulosonate-7-phosphate synthase [Saccharothrix carnea]
MDNAVRESPPRIALQQPDWDDHELVRRVRATLTSRPGLVTSDEVGQLRTTLAMVAAGGAHVVQAGDCAEDFAECEAGYVARKAGLLDLLAGVMKMATHLPVVRIGRIAGQFAKPRSSPTEVVGNVELRSFLGHMVNSPEPDAEGRRPDPNRMLAGYDAARTVTSLLGWGGGGFRLIDPPMWTSHEALLLDYEIPMLRRDRTGRMFLSSTHLPWIGDRTRQLDGAHVDLLAGVANPIACKVGPTMTAAELLALAERLDPHREPGRLTLISRMGSDLVAERLPSLVAAVRAAGHPVIWLCDPMHGNTVRTPDGLKTRYVETVVAEIERFQHALRAEGGVAGGLHLETTPDDVTECAYDESGAARVGDKYTTYCDPRLNPDQAVAAVAAWAG